MSEEMSVLAGTGEGVLPEAEKEARYRALARDIAAVLEGETSLQARFATVACLLHHAFEAFYWTGFYLVDPARPEELVVGPYQGTLGCLRIAFGRGVCGAAAASGQTQVVADVAAFPGHIACDAASKSEIVVPVRDSSGALIAVLDIDSDLPAAFDAVDARHLEALVGDIFATAPAPSGSA